MYTFLRNYQYKVYSICQSGVERGVTTMIKLRRKMEKRIEAWYASTDRRPLLIRGARRTGKTFLIEHVGARLAGTNFVKLDFQTNLNAISSLFDGPTDDVDGIVSRIGEYKRTRLNPETALIFLDEVQLDERALNSLRFFADSKWRVIASGSLLGVTTRQRHLPFPSGVIQEELHPLDFEEFLWAAGESFMAESIREHSRTLEPYVLHEDALSLYRRYLTTGGMPLPVRQWFETHDEAEVALLQREIDETYTADMTDPGNGISGVSAKRIWDSIPRQLLRASTKKFKYSDVVRGGRRGRLLEPLEWLSAAGIVTIHDLTRDTQAPLAPYNDESGSFFKVYVSDTGLMFGKFGVEPSLVLDRTLSPLLSSDFRGALAENYVMQSLKANGLKTFYWMPDENSGRGEVDFVFQTRSAEVIPIEVKSARNVSAKSLRKLMREGHSPYAIRLSEQQFGKSEGEGGTELRSLPLYAAFCIGAS